MSMMIVSGSAGKLLKGVEQQSNRLRAAVFKNISGCLKENQTGGEPDWQPEQGREHIKALLFFRVLVCFFSLCFYKAP